MGWEVLVSKVIQQIPIEQAPRSHLALGLILVFVGSFRVRLTRSDGVWIATTCRVRVEPVFLGF